MGRKIRERSGLVREEKGTVQMNRRKQSTIASNFERMHIFALAGVFLFGFFGPLNRLWDGTQASLFFSSPSFRRIYLVCI